MLKTYLAIQNLKHDALDLLRGVERDESGATMIEYAIMIGVITVGAIASIVFVGGWVGDQWADLQAALTPTP